MALNQQDAIRHLHTRGFPKRLLHKYVGENAFDLIENDNDSFLEGKDVCRRYAEQFSQLPMGTGLVIVGREGSGKSLLACVTVFEIFKKGSYSVRMTDVDGVIMSINSKWVKSQDQVFDVYEPNILVIDDFPKTLHQSRDVKSLIEKVYRQRYDKGKTTIITARCTTEQAKAEFGSSFFSFLQESAILVKGLAYSNDYRELVRPKLK